jgi:hypothetical protein
LADDEGLAKEHLLRKIDQLLQRLLQQEDRAPAPSRPKWGVRFANSPIVLTLAGGVFVSFLTTRWQADQAERQQAREARLELRERRHDLIAAFAVQIVASLEYARAYKDRECWIVDHAMEPEARYDDGRTAAETRQVVETIREKYASVPTADALCARIRGLFPDCEPIRREADELDGIMDRFMHAQSRSQILERYGEADRSYQELITLMELETTREDTLEETR